MHSIQMPCCCVSSNSSLSCHQEEEQRDSLLEKSCGEMETKKDIETTFKEVLSITTSTANNNAPTASLTVIQKQPIINTTKNTNFIVEGPSTPKRNNSFTTIIEPPCQKQIYREAKKITKERRNYQHFHGNVCRRLTFDNSLLTTTTTTATAIYLPIMNLKVVPPNNNRMF
ncbi:hypothetical protein ABK040_007677 [Willaertia magna]